MARQRKPAVLQERAGAYRHNPQRRRRDLKGRGELPSRPPDWLSLSAQQERLYVRIAELIPKGVASGSDLIIVALAARSLSKIQTGKYRSADMAQTRALLNSLALSPAARAALGAGGESPNENPFEEFGPESGAKRGDAPN